MTDWLKAPHKDAQGNPRRIAVGPTKDAVNVYARKLNKSVEQFASRQFTQKVRSGSVVRDITAVRWYGLLSA